VTCAAHLGKQRAIASALVIAPFYALGLVMFAANSGGVAMLCLAVGAAYFYWARLIGYSWADRIVYGDDLQDRLARYVPMGDVPSNTEVKLPPGAAYGFLRVGIACLPMALLVGLAIVYTTLQPRDAGRTSSATTSPSATPGETAAPGTRPSGGSYSASPRGTTIPPRTRTVPRKPR
jgi:hypothetical protein